MDKFCEDCIHNEVCQYGAIPPHIDRCNDKDTLDDIRPKGKWIGVVYSKNRIGVGRCNQCEANRIIDNFCPHCGADMRGAE